MKKSNTKKFGRFDRINSFTKTRNSGFLRSRKIADSRHTIKKEHTGKNKN